MLYGGNPEIFDDVVHVRQPHPLSPSTKIEGGREQPYPETDIFFFPYGVFVAWGVGFQEVTSLADHVAKYEIKPLAFQLEGYDFSDIENTPPTYEEFDYSYGSSFRIDRLKVSLSDSKSDSIYMTPPMALTAPWHH